MRHFGDDFALHDAAWKETQTGACLREPKTRYFKVKIRKQELVLRDLDHSVSEGGGRGEERARKRGVVAV
jgi:hypothetical protein